MLYIVSRIDNIFQNVQNAIAEVETRIPKTDPKYNDAIEAAKEERFKKEFKNFRYMSFFGENYYDKFDVTDISASRKQIKWEFEHLEKTDIFSIYFCNSGSVQPICLYELGRNIVRMQQRFPNDWEDRIVISIENGYSRYLDVVEQTSLCAPKLWININATPKSHAMRIGEKFAKLDE